MRSRPLAARAPGGDDGLLTLRALREPPSPPSRRACSYKLLCTNKEGRVRERYTGGGTAAAVAGLTPSCDYIFCVKAAYSDGSWTWSQAVMLRTAPQPVTVRLRTGPAARQGSALRALVM